MNDALTLIAETKIDEAERLNIFFERKALCTGVGFFYKCFGIFVVCTGGCRNVLGTVLELPKRVVP